MRTTIGQIEAAVKRLNELAGTPADQYSRDADGKATGSNIGNYHTSKQYGGVQIQQIANKGGATRAITNGHEPKRECLARLHAFIKGIESTLA